MTKEPLLYNQIIPLIVAAGSGLAFLLILAINVHLTNLLLANNPILLVFRFTDFLLGIYLYLKTSVDFAVFIGSMIHANPGWKNRIAVEWGTSLGNFVGTIAIIWVWILFHALGPIFEGTIILLASFILLELAAGSLYRLQQAGWDRSTSWHHLFYKSSYSLLSLLRRFTSPFLKWMPDVKGTMAGKKAANLTSLLLYSFTIPFVLGSDDFAGYMSIFNVVNIFPFAVGVIVGHSLLLAGIFAIPQTVEKIMAKPLTSALAVTTFLIIFTIGTIDGGKLLIAWGQKNPLPFVVYLALVASYILTHQHLHRLIQTNWSQVRKRALDLISKEA